MTNLNDMDITSIVHAIVRRSSMDVVLDALREAATTQADEAVFGTAERWAALAKRIESLRHDLTMEI